MFYPGFIYMGLWQIIILVLILIFKYILFIYSIQ